MLSFKSIIQRKLKKLHLLFDSIYLMDFELILFINSSIYQGLFIYLLIEIQRESI